MRFSFLFNIGLIITLSFLKNATQAQTKKYVIYFTDKNNTPYSVNKPEEFLSQRAILRRQKQNILITNRDLPVNKVYADSLNSLGANMWYTSKWFNAAVIEADSVTQSVINNLGFVKNSENLTKKRVSSVVEKKLAFEKNSFPKRVAKTNKININYGPSFNQAAMIGADLMHADGYRGEGMIIGILDAGFANADTLPVFDSLFANNRILGTYDFVTNDLSVYEDYWHGTAVLSTIGGYLEGQIIGTAYKASFFLFRTEDVFSEFHIEEINWLIAAEYADSAGVDVINTSLGYTDFDDPTMNYTYADMDGNTALITRAADFAAATGMLIVNSAGNFGNSSWQYIAAPADGDSVLTVGAVDSNEVYASFSSQGPSYDGRIKPNLMAQGLNIWAATSSGGFTYSSGTSFSSPILCGMAAGFWQANPGLSNMEVIDFLQRSASFYDNPNDQYGYGIPDYALAKKLTCSTVGQAFIVDLGNDSILCTGSNITLAIDSISSSVSYLWNTGDTTQSISVNSTGIYYVSVESDYCLQTDTIFVDFIKVDLGNDSILCTGSNITLAVDSFSSNVSYLWNTGDTTQSIIVNTTGTYYVSVESDYCLRTDTIFVDFIKMENMFPNPFSEGSSISFCIGPDNIGSEVIVKIFDTCGKLIFTEKIINAKMINQLNINTKTLPPGIYLISVITPNALYTIKVVKI